MIRLSRIHPVFRYEADQALVMLFWAFWTSPLWQHFLFRFLDDTPLAARVLAPIPLSVWTSAAVVLSVFRYAAAFLYDMRTRAIAAVLSGCFWMTVGLLFVINRPLSPGTAVYCGLSYLCFASMWRIRT